VRIFTFGDSWAAGWGLKKTEKNFTDFLGEALNCRTMNYGESSSSLGQITHEFTCRHKDITSQDLVIVIIPPDTRWYTQRGHLIQSMFDYKTKEYKQFIKGKTDYWFIYHHSLFILTIYSICHYNKIPVIMAHNYGDLVLMPELQYLIPKNIFLNPRKSLTKLLKSKDWENNYSLQYNGSSKPLMGDYFIENDDHPNELGHKRISELLLKKYRKKYECNK